MCNVFIQEISIFSRSVKEHCDHGVKCFNDYQTDKCSLGCPEMCNLGQIVSKKKRVSPDPDRLEVAKRFPVLTDVKPVQKITGLAGTFSWIFTNSQSNVFIVVSNAKFQWMDECCVAFEHMKKLLTSPPVLSSPGFTKQFVLHIGANGEGLGVNYQLKARE